MIKLCKDCRHFANSSIRVWCAAPQNGISLVTGKPREVYAKENRDNNTKCGMDGRFFEPIPPAPDRPWWKLWVDN